MWGIHLLRCEMLIVANLRLRAYETDRPSITERSAPPLAMKLPTKVKPAETTTKKLAVAQG